MTGPTADRRRQPRLRLTLPVRVQGHSASGAAWAEATRCDDASQAGCSFVLEHAVLTGQVLRISVPLPAGLRRYDLSKPNYDTYAIVRSTHLGGATAHVGVAFLGRTPPPGYEEAPGARFLPDRRKSPRAKRCLQIRLEGAGRAHETTVLEDLGAGGARVRSVQALGAGDLVRIEEAAGSFSACAEVRGVHVGKDGVRRLHLRFVDVSTGAPAAAAWAEARPRA